MKIDVNKLKKAVPLIKEYAENRGRHVDQPFPEKGDHYYRNAVSAFIRDGKMERKSRATSYCYASLFKVVKKEDIILLQVQPCWDDLPEEAYRHYIDWVINYSPWRHAFISKNINRILKDGVAVLDASVETKSYIKEAAIALRMAWENYASSNKYQEIDLWWDVAQKVDPKLSYIAAKAMFKPHTNNLKEIIVKSCDEGHAPINYYGSDKPNYHLTGWLKELRIKKSWRSVPISTTQVIISITDMIDKTDVIVNPFPNYHNPSKKFKRGAFVEAMHSELPKLAEKIYA